MKRRLFRSYCIDRLGVIYYASIMKKLMSFVSAAVCAAAFNTFAQDVEDNELESSEEKAWSLGFDADFLTAYQWRNHVSNDEGAFHGCLWGDIDVYGPFSVGGYVWQNYDFTSRRRDSYATAHTETDFGVHAGLTAWESDEESEGEPMSLDFELGHEWYTYHRVRDMRAFDPTTREIYLKATFSNPLVTPYGQVSWMYDDFGCYQSGFHYEIGLTKEVEVTETVSVGADWNIGFADHDYHDFLIGTDTSGITGTTIALFSKLAVTDWMSLKGTIAYTGMLNRDARRELKQDGGEYPRDQLWGSLSVNLEF